jgi:hypothetical protein
MDKTVTEKTIRSKILEGMHSQGLRAAGGPGTGTMTGAMKPLIDYLKKKGIVVK